MWEVRSLSVAVRRRMRVHPSRTSYCSSTGNAVLPTAVAKVLIRASAERRLLIRRHGRTRRCRVRRVASATVAAARPRVAPETRLL